ncbi:hypothetical protein ZWY2020_053910 [Hordeum vulgare]|nr:hypothetical protein ZWY2020_053910 [Hordeum vulgare]
MPAIATHSAKSAPRTSRTPLPRQSSLHPPQPLAVRPSVRPPPSHPPAQLNRSALPAPPSARPCRLTSRPSRRPVALHGPCSLLRPALTRAALHRTARSPRCPPAEDGDLPPASPRSYSPVPREKSSSLALALALAHPLLDKCPQWQCSSTPAINALPPFLGSFSVRDSTPLAPLPCSICSASAPLGAFFPGLGALEASACPLPSRVPLPAHAHAHALASQPVQKVSILEPPSYCYPPPPPSPPLSLSLIQPPLSFPWPLLSSPIKASASQPSPVQSTTRVLNGIEFWPEPSGSAFQVLEARAG